MADEYIKKYVDEKRENEIPLVEVSYEIKDAV